MPLYRPGSAFLAACLLTYCALSASVSARQDSSRVEWKAGSPAPTATLFNTALTLSPAPDGSAVSVLFADEKITLNASQNQLKSGSVTLTATGKSGYQIAGFRADLRGWCAKTTGVSALLIADMNGMVRVFQVPLGTRREKRAEKTQKNFFVSLTSIEKPQPSRNLNLTVTLRLYRTDTASAADTAEVQIDSLDVTPLLRKPAN